MRRFLQRPWWASLLAVSLLLGGLDLHPEGESHGSLASLGVQGSYCPEAAHPDQPVHFEQGAPVKVPPCPACLHRLETSGAHLSELTHVVPPVLRDRVLRAADPRPLQAASRPSGARGPPSFS